MSETPTLTMYERDTTITPSRLRRIGYVPATLYGNGFTPLSVQIKAHEFGLLIAKGVRRFTLEGMGRSINVTLQQLQQDRAKEILLHAEFLVAPGQADLKPAAAAHPSAAPEPAPIV